MLTEAEAKGAAWRTRRLGLYDRGVYLSRLNVFRLGQVYKIRPDSREVVSGVLEKPTRIQTSQESNRAERHKSRIELPFLGTGQPSGFERPLDDPPHVFQKEHFKPGVRVVIGGKLHSLQPFVRRQIDVLKTLGDLEDLHSAVDELASQGEHRPDRV